MEVKEKKVRWEEKQEVQATCHPNSGNVVSCQKFLDISYVQLCPCVGVHMCECDDLDWNRQELSANDQKSKHITVYMLKSGLVVSLPVLFFFSSVWSNPHNPLGVICSCSVIWGKASFSPSLCSSICTSSLHPSLTL